MGHRVLKRVPLDFKAPIGKIWEGYLNPHPCFPGCVTCDSSGYNEATKQIADDFYDLDGDRSRRWCNKITQDEVLALAFEGRLHHFTHIWVDGSGWHPKRWGTKGYWCPGCYVAVPQLSPEHYAGYCIGCGEQKMLLLHETDVRLHMPTAEEVNAMQDRAFLMSHDAINRWILVEARAKRLGVWGTCRKCRGRGYTRLPRKMKKRYKSWKEYEPPTGPGYQLWETTSEGSPVSPVFAKVEKLAEWCEENATVFGSERTSMETWLQMFRDDTVGVGSLLVAGSGYVGSIANSSP
ncbi:MAG: hypothetical protein G01um101420_781 [Parcubacteria group bacterium Gr01-1014_20]|nr:MAG: hypothetical protein G01um101420_781 [Parcubacteria group bacterium Gr01-1014_20]